MDTNECLDTGELRNLREFYDISGPNPFKDYVDKLCIKHKITVDEALEWELVKEYFDYFSKSFEKKDKSGITHTKSFEKKDKSGITHTKSFIEKVGFGTTKTEIVINCGC